ncbi:hypothetical protein [Luedemannella flava]|uniref:hypothetical protein n=1 Tax=Luedemannella flava TaxID=349316 RepID=UPI0031D3440F
MTSETGEYFAAADGLYEARISAAPVRARKGDGWAEVDLTLIKGADGTVAPKAHPGALTMSGQVSSAGEHELAAVGHGEGRVAMSWTGPLPEPMLDGDTATYADVLPDVDLVVRATRTGFQELLKVKTRAGLAKVRDITLPVTSKAAASFMRDAGGNLAIKNDAGKVFARIPAPQMWDAKPIATGQAPERRNIDTRVTKRAAKVVEKAGLDLRLLPDTDWLDDTRRVFPITIDPTINPLYTTFDTYVKQGDTVDRGGENDLQFGLVSGDVARSLVRWDTTEFAGTYVSSATTYFWNWWSPTCTAKSWDMWTTSQNVEGMVWTTQPDWLVKEASSTQTKGFSSSCNDGWVSVSSTTFFRRAADNNQNRGYMGLRATSETDANAFKQFRSRNAADSSQVPYTNITYNRYPVMGTRSTVPATTCVTGTSRPYINTKTPTLKAKVTDPDGLNTKAEFEWYVAGGAKIGGATTAYGTSGSTYATTVPAGAFAENGTYSWRVHGSDEYLWADWEDPCEFKVDTTPPATPTITSTSHPIQSAYYNSSTLTASLAASDTNGVAGYAVKIDTAATTSPGTTVTQTAVTVSAAGQTEGVHYLHVAAVDLAGNWSPAAHYQFKVDTGKPGAPTNPTSSTHPSSDIAYPSRTMTVSWGAPEDASGVSSYVVVVDQSDSTIPDTSPTQTAMTFTTTVPTDGTWWVHIRARDGAGNWSATAVHLKFMVYTGPPPAPTITSTSHANPDLVYPNGSFTASWSAVSGATGYSLVVDNVATTTPDTTVDQTTLTYNATRTDGVWYLHVAAQNAAGTWGTPAHFKFTVDTAAPSQPAVVSSTHLDPSQWYSTSAFAATLTATDSGSGLNGYAVVIDQSPGTLAGNIVTQTTANVTASGLADGAYWLHVAAQDKAGNWSTTQHFAFNIDTTKPSAPSALTSLTHPSPTQLYPSRQVTVSWNPPADTSGVTQYAVIVDKDPDTMPPSLATQTTTTYTTTVDADGVWWVHIRTGDAAGNWSDTAAHLRFVADTTQPLTPVVSSTTHPDPTKHYSSGAFTGSWPAPAGADGYSVQIDDKPATTPDTTIDTIATSYSGNYGDGVWYLHVRAVNAAGTWSPAGHWKFTIDTTAPPAPTVTSTDYPAEAWAGQPGMPGLFTLSAGGATDVVSYRYGLDENPPTHTEPTTTAGASAAVVVTPDAVGTHVLYVVAIDAAGNQSTSATYTFRVSAASATGTLTLDGTPLTLTTTVSGQQATATFNATTGQRISLGLSDNSMGHGVSVKLLGPDGSIVASASGIPESGTFIDATAVPATGAYTIVVDPADDAVGHITIRAYTVVDQALTTEIGDTPTATSITTPGQNATWTFQGTAGQRVALDLTTTATGMRLSITKPDGTLLKTAWHLNGSSFIDPETLPNTGEYTLTVDPDGPYTGPIGIRLYDVPVDVTTVGELGGMSTTVAVQAPGQNGIVTFEATTGVKTYVLLEDLSNPSVSMAFTMRDPSGAIVGNAYKSSANPSAAIGPLDLSTTGTYSLIIDPSGMDVGTFSIHIYKFQAPTVVTTSVGGPSVTLTVTAPNQTADAIFAAAAGQRISVLVAGPGGFYNDNTTTPYRIELLDPSGATMQSEDGYGDYPVLIRETTIPVDGSYTIRIDPAGLGVGFIKVQVSNLPAEETVATTVDGDPFDVALPTPGMSTLVQFNALARQPLAIGATSGPDSLGAELVAPNGETVCNTTLTAMYSDLCMATIPGIYKLRLTVKGATGGTWKIHILNAVRAPIANVDLGEATGEDGWSSSSTATVTWHPNNRFSITQLPVAGYAVSVDQIPTNDPGTTLTQSADGWSGQLTDGVHYLHVRTIMPNGYAGPVAHQMIKIDTTAPTMTTVTLTSHPDPNVPVNSSDVVAEFTSSPDLSGVSYAVSVTHGADDVPSDAPISGAVFTKNLPGEGQWYLHVVPVDGAGNRGEAAHRKFLVDLPPGAPKITSMTHPVPGTTYSNDMFVAAWQASDTSATVWAVALDHSHDTVPSTTTTTAEPRWDAQLASGTWWLHVRGVDLAGTAGATAHFKVIVDAPAIHFLAPVPGRGVWGTIPVTVACSSGVTQLTIQARLRGGAWQEVGAATRNDDACSATWNTTGTTSVWPDGAYDLRALDGTEVVAGGSSVTLANNTNVLERLAFDYQAGTISAADYVQIGLFGLTDPTAVPVRYSGGAVAVGNIDAARAELLRLWPALAPSEQEEISAWLEPTEVSRPSTTSGRSSNALASNNPDCSFWVRLSGRNFGCRVKTDHFTIYYDEGDIDQTTTGGNVRPDFIENLKTTLEQARTAFKNELGYKVPNDVVVQVQWLPAGTGLSLPPAGCLTCGDGTMFLTRDSQNIKGLARHELFHFVQYQYMNDRFAGDYWMNWWMEATAEWGEHTAAELAGESGIDSDYYSSLDAFLAESSERYDEGDTVISGGGPEYGAFIVAEFLEERLLRDSIRQSWERLVGDAPPLPGAVIKELIEQRRVDGNFADEIQRFREWAYTIDKNTSGVGFQDSDATRWKQSLDDADFPGHRPRHDTVTIDETGPGAAGTVEGTTEIQQTGAHYIEIKNPKKFDTDVTVTFDADSPAVRGSIVLLDEDGLPTNKCGDSKPLSGSPAVTLTVTCPGAFITMVNAEYGGKWATWSDVTYQVTYQVTGLVLSNGFVDLGMSAFGHLGIASGVGARLLDRPDTEWIARFQGDGWGVNTPIGPNYLAFSHYAGGSKDLSLNGVRMTDAGDGIISTVTALGSLEIIHRIEPAPVRVPNCPPSAGSSCLLDSRYLYKMQVFVINFGAPISDMTYARSIDWDNGGYWSYNSLQTLGGDTSYLDRAGDDGYCQLLESPNPTPVTGVNWEGDTRHLCGPDITLKLGRFESNDIKFFTIYFGVAPDAATALSAVTQVGAQVYSTGKPLTPDGLANGTPSTGVFAIDGSDLV